MKASEVPEFIEIARTVRAAMIACLERRADGSYYATPTGCARLQRILDDHKIRATVRVGDEGRFEVTMSGPPEHIW